MLKIDSPLKTDSPGIITNPPIVYLESQEIPACCSKASKVLTQQVLQAIADVKPIILQALPGSGKTFIANFIHSQSSLKNTVFAEVDCGQLARKENGEITIDTLLGGSDRPGLIANLQQGTLLIDNFHLLTEQEGDRLLDLLKKGESSANQVRLILASPKTINISNCDVHRIKLFSLVQRREDIGNFANYFLKKICQKQNRPVLQLSQIALRRLISYDYPNNLAELEIILKRAVLMTPSTETMINEQVLWSVQSKKNKFRIDLLEYIPGLRQLVLSDIWLAPFWAISMIIFLLMVVLGFVGLPMREESLILNVFWAWWWPVYLLALPIIGRFWCAVCPFMITGELLRNISQWIYPHQLKSWPTQWLNKWGAWFVWSGFLIIYLWEKLWDLPHSAYLSAWLLLIITAGAVICTQIYERRLWCRYLCPIGGMNGMFAKLAVIELRATEQLCGSVCDVKACQKPTCGHKVNFAEALPNEGQDSYGCPLYSPPAQLSNNRDCVLCMGCVKSCPNRSVQLNLRFPAADLLENHRGFMAEAFLLLLLFGGVFMHNSQKILGWFGLANLAIDSQHLLIAVPISLILLSLPAIVTYFTHKISERLDPQMPDYVTIIYAYLPMTLVANLIYYLHPLITESGKILPIIAQNLGLHSLILPTLTWGIEVANFVQGMTLLSVIPFSIFPLLKISQRPLLGNLPHILLMLGLVGLFGIMMVV